MDKAKFDAAMAALVAVATTVQKTLGVPAEAFISDLQASERLLRESGRTDAADELQGVLSGVIRAWRMIDQMQSGERPN